LSPGGSGYFTCTQNLKLVTTKFKSGGLHEKHVMIKRKCLTLLATETLSNQSSNSFLASAVPAWCIYFRKYSG